jgi:hypothetical protein
MAADACAVDAFAVIVWEPATVLAGIVKLWLNVPAAPTWAVPSTTGVLLRVIVATVFAGKHAPLTSTA